MARIIRVGTLLVQGPQITFQPAPEQEFEVRQGEEVHLEAEYRFEEGALRRETCLIEFRVTVGRRMLGPKDLRLDDTPLVKDRARGYLRHTTRIEESGTVPLIFALTATYTAKPWKGSGKAEVVDVRKEGRLRLRIT